MNVIVEYSDESTLDVLKGFGDIIYKSKSIKFIYLRLRENVSINRIASIPGVINVEEKSL